MVLIIIILVLAGGSFYWWTSLKTKEISSDIEGKFNTLGSQLTSIKINLDKLGKTFDNN